MGAVMGGRPERGPGVLLSSTRAKSAKRCDVDQCVSSVQDRPRFLIIIMIYLWPFIYLGSCTSRPRGPTRGGCVGPREC